MRVKTELSERPPLFTVSRENQLQAVITFYTDVHEVQREDGVSWSAVSWSMTGTWTDGLEARIAADPDSWFSLISAQCYAAAAAEVRARRDALLQATDADMALDRLGLTPPTGSTFTAWLSFLRTLGEALKGKASVYRQALRDITTQPGFPYEIEWPEMPK